MPNKKARTFKDAIRFLDENSGIHRYGDLAEAIGYTRKTGGRAVDAMMRAIHNRGMHEYCRRVVLDSTGKHDCNAT